MAWPQGLQPQEVWVHPSQNCLWSKRSIYWGRPDVLWQGSPLANAPGPAGKHQDAPSGLGCLSQNKPHQGLQGSCCGKIKQNKSRARWCSWEAARRQSLETQEAWVSFLIYIDVLPLLYIFKSPAGFLQCSQVVPMSAVGMNLRHLERKGIWGKGGKESAVKTSIFLWNHIHFT